MSRHVKVIWGSSEVIKGHWYLGVFGIYDRVEGKHDDLPESAFYMVGGIDEAIAKAKKLAEDA